MARPEDEVPKEVLSHRNRDRFRLLTDDAGPHERSPLEIAHARRRDVIDPRNWAGELPQTYGVPPRIRLGARWINVLWALPILAGALLVSIAVAKGIRGIPAVQAFLHQYPGTIVPPRTVSIGIPWWARWQHFFNLFFLMFMVRSGLQILADHPRLYFDRNSTPGRDWFRFQNPVPQDRVWTAKEDSVRLPGWLGIPGLRHSIGLARWWHFGFDLLWLANGIVFYVLLFTSGHWQRLVPGSLSVFPNAASVALQYLSLDFPQNQGWIAYNGLQLLSYFVTVFIAAPLAVATGLLQSPAISNRIHIAGRRFNRQLARSVHFLVLCWFVAFTLIHTAMVYSTGLLNNLNHVTLGQDNAGWAGFGLYLLGMAIVVAAWLAATPLTLSHPRLIQRVGERIVGSVEGLFEHVDPRPGQYTERDIAPYLWANGKMPTTAQYEAMAADDFSTFRLRVDGAVRRPVDLSLEQVKALARQEQITCHHCIQGWSGVAKWTGVPMRVICDLVQPEPKVRYAVFYSFVDGPDGGLYYDVHHFSHMYHRLTILAYEVNDRPLGLVHGAPLRLRNEVELGYKMVKWVQRIEFVESFAEVGKGRGGYNADHEFFGYRAGI